MCANSDNCNCTLTIPRGPRGFQGEGGPAPTFNTSVTTLPPGSDATAQVTGTSPNLTLNLGLVTGDPGVGTPGANGTNGLPAFTSLLNNFTQPQVGFTVAIQTAGSFQWSVIDEPIFISGGGKYTVTSTPVAPYTTLIVRNDGGTGNAAPLSLVTATGAAAQVTPTGRDGVVGTPGLPGAPGTPGPAGVIRVVNSVPISAPAANETFKIYTDSPTTPTIVTGYSWDSIGSIWQATVNLTPAAGTQTIFVNGDPNVVLPAGPIGTVAIRIDLVSQIDYYIKSTISTWTLQKSITIANTITQTVIAGSNSIAGEVLSTNRVIGFRPLLTTISAPVTYTIDLAYQGHYITADKAVGFDWDDTLYAEAGEWMVQIENVDGSAINLTYAAGRWARDPALTLPATLAAAATQMYVIRKNIAGDRMIVTNTFVVTNV
jgi:hypothetical protein